MTVPTITALRLTGAADRAELPLLVLGPALGTSAAALWTECAAGLVEVFDVVAWDLPGHGYNDTVPHESFSMSELATGVVRVLDEVLEQREQYGGSFAYAGVSLGGAVGLQLLLDHPDRVRAAVLLGTGAKIGDPSIWAGRVGQVSISGTSVLVPGAAERWFSADFADRAPDRAAGILHALERADDRAYIQACEALAEFDVRGRLHDIAAPVLAVAGGRDGVTPSASLLEIADAVSDGRFVEIAGASHLLPALEPAQVAGLIRQHLLGESPVDATATGAIDPIRDLAQLTDEYESDGVWTRPGLDRRSRSLITLAALLARDQHEEFAQHLRAARANGVTDVEINELILHSAVYCGVPSARAAARIARRVLAERDRPDGVE